MKITSYILILALLILSCKDDDATGLPEPEEPTAPEQVVTDILVQMDLRTSIPVQIMILCPIYHKRL